MLRKKEGALLLSGKIGVGKTSAVISALKYIKENQLVDPNFPYHLPRPVGSRKSTRSELTTGPYSYYHMPFYEIEQSFFRESVEQYRTIIVPVFVNAPSFDIRRKKSETGQPEEIDLLEFKRVVLQSLVRRLFEASKTWGIIEDPLYTRYKRSRNKLKLLQLALIRLLYPRYYQYFKYAYRRSKTDKQLRVKIATLYRKAIAAEFKQEDKLEELKPLSVISAIKLTIVDLMVLGLLLSIICIGAS